MNIPAIRFDGSEDISSVISIPLLLDRCPTCEMSGEMKPVFTFGNALKTGNSDGVQVVMQCPRSVCRALAVATYRAHYKDFSGSIELTGHFPSSVQKKKFPETIANISPEFITIYQQSLQAEGSGLDKVAGVGYRKALEFLIKDYLIQEHPEREDEIKKKALGKCIDKDVTNDNIKLVAKRATWLGNDETHYTRVWAGKDVSDLKMLIDLTVHWLDSEALTKKLIMDMPDTKEESGE